MLYLQKRPKWKCFITFQKPKTWHHEIWMYNLQPRPCKLDSTVYNCIQHHSQNLLATTFWMNQRYKPASTLNSTATKWLTQLRWMHCCKPATKPTRRLDEPCSNEVNRPNSRWGERPISRKVNPIAILPAETTPR